MEKASDEQTPPNGSASIPLKLLLHCESGSPPYLTPMLLSKYFSPESRIVREHLILGIELRDSCVVPVYGDRGGGAKNKKNAQARKRRRLDRSGKTSVVASKDGVADADVDADANGAAKARGAMTKPIGYTFACRPIPEHLSIRSGYETMACSSFDLLDGIRPNSVVPATASDVTVNTTHGYQKLSPPLLREVTGGMGVTHYVGLYDQSAKSGKRTTKSVERTKAWTSYVQETARPETAASFWAPVVGGDDASLWSTCLDHAMALKHLHGICMVGLHHIESRDIRKKLIADTVQKLPRNVPCAVLVANDLMQILDAALSGARLVGSALPTLMARSHKAFSFDIYGWNSTAGLNTR